MAAPLAGPLGTYRPSWIEPHGISDETRLISMQNLDSPIDQLMAFVPGLLLVIVIVVLMLRRRSDRRSTSPSSIGGYSTTGTGGVLRGLVALAVVLLVLALIVLFVFDQSVEDLALFLPLVLLAVAFVVLTLRRRSDGGSSLGGYSASGTGGVLRRLVALSAVLLVIAMIAPLVLGVSIEQLPSLLLPLLPFVLIAIGVVVLVGWRRSRDGTRSPPEIRERSSFGPRRVPRGLVGFAAGLLVLAVIGLFVTDIVYRFFLNSPSNWFDLAGQIAIAAAGPGVALASMTGRHPCGDLAERLLGGIGHVVREISAAVVFAFLAWVAFEGAIRQFEQGETSFGLELPLWPATASLFAGLAIATLAHVGRVFAPSNQSREDLDDLEPDPS